MSSFDQNIYFSYRSVFVTQELVTFHDLVSTPLLMRICPLPLMIFPFCSAPVKTQRVDEEKKATEKQTDNATDEKTSDSQSNSVT